MKIVQGNILESKEQVIAHQCNCITRGNGRGLAWDIFEKYPNANEYKNRKVPSKLGTISLKKKIINMYSQYYPGRVKVSGKDTENMRLIYFEKCLNTIAKIKGLKNIAFPYQIGCGRGGGDWEKYYDLLLKFDLENKNIEVVIYKLDTFCFCCDDESVFGCECGTKYCLECGLNQGDVKNDTYIWCVNCNTLEKTTSDKRCSSNKNDHSIYVKESILTTIRDIPIPEGWEEFFEDNKSLIDKISNEIQKETAIVYPPIKDVFNAFHYCKPENIRVVIIGQDCYHGEGQAMGLSFSVRDGIKPPPSLKNIYKEMESDGFSINDKSSGNLSTWTKNGVFLYNTALTVEKGQPGTHIKKWKIFTDQVIKYINYNCDNLVFILWGKHAQGYKQYLKSSHHVIESAHPSPYSADSGFFNSHPFSQTNEYLKSIGLDSIDWNL